MLTLNSAKIALRSELKLKLKNIPAEEKNYQSDLVIKKLLSHPKYQNSSRISVYLSRDIEINTTALLNNIFDSKKECFIPRYDSTKPLMDMTKLISIDDYNNLPLTKWKIKQPSDNEERENALLTGGLDLMIVPGLGFTKGGHRIGNGKGYYDIYMKNYVRIFGKPVYTIALAFKEQILESIPVSDHDVVINEVIYPDV